MLGEIIYLGDAVTRGIALTAFMFGEIGIKDSVDH